DYRPGDRGILLAHGDQSGGYVFYVEEGRLHLYYHAFGLERRLAGGPLAPRPREIGLDPTAPGPNLWHCRLSADGRAADPAAAPRMLSSSSPLEALHVGLNRRSPVSWELHERHGTFPYTGALRSVTYTPSAVAPDRGPQLVAQLREAGLRYE